jgi:hypothetical protein
MTIKIPSLFHSGLSEFIREIPESFVLNFPIRICSAGYSSLILQHLSNMFPISWESAKGWAKIALNKLGMNIKLSFYSLEIPLRLNMVEFNKLANTPQTDLDRFFIEVEELGCFDPKSWSITLGNRDMGERIARPSNLPRSFLYPTRGLWISRVF